MKVTRKSRIKQVLEDVEKYKNRVVSSAAKEAVEVMERLVPVADGDLKSTLTNEDDGRGHAKVSAGGESNISDKFVNYAAHQEFGTFKTPAQSFFRPGLDAGKRKLRSELKG